MPESKTTTWQEDVVESLKSSDGPILLGEGTVYAVPSRTDEFDFHLIVCYASGLVTCSCRGFRFRDTCFHVTDLTRRGIISSTEGGG